MIITDKRKDYYDSIQKYGREPTIRYIREPEEHLLEYNYPIGKKSVDNIPVWLCNNSFTEVYGYFSDSYCDPLLIGFCGEIYFGVCFKNFIDKQLKCFYSYDSCMKYIKQTFRKSESDFDSKVIRDFKEHFNQFPNKSFSKVFEDKNCPIFLVFRQGLEWNPMLGPFQFQKVKSPSIAYQELSMWIGNQAQPHKIPTPLTDVENAERHGFDKYSFRKEPTKKR